jgi:hypothetical protein
VKRLTVGCSATGGGGGDDDNDAAAAADDDDHHLSFIQNRCNIGSTRIEPHSLNTTCRVHFLLKT